MKKILVAEDDKFLANAYRVKLTKANYEVRMASDGEELLSVIEEFQPDLILLDLVMPNKDGFSALSELRANPRWSRLPIIVASNLGQKEDIDKAKKLGASDYVVKSDLAMKDLVIKIASYIGQ